MIEILIAVVAGVAGVGVTAWRLRAGRTMWATVKAVVTGGGGGGPPEPE